MIVLKNSRDGFEFDTAEMKDLLREYDSANGIGIGPEPNGLSRLMIKHVTNGASAAFNVRDADYSLHSSVKADETVGIHAGLDKPNTIMIVNGHAVRS